MLMRLIITCRLDGLVFQAKPTTPGNVLWQSLVLDEFGSGRGERFGQAIANYHCHELWQRLGSRGMPAWLVARRCQREPIETKGRQGKEISQFADRRKCRPGTELHGNTPSKLRQIKLDGLRAVREIGNTQEGFAGILAKVGQDFAIFGREQCQRAAAKAGMPATDARACVASN